MVYPYFMEHYFVNQSQFGIYFFVIVPILFIGLGERGYILFGEKVDVKICTVLFLSIFFLVKLREAGTFES